MDSLSGILHNGMVLMIGVLLVLAIAYRYYSAFIAAKVLALDPNRPTPAHTMRDGQNYDPTNKWVLFGHHFAAISGAGPLIGPVLAAQFGFLPGLLWILIGVCLAGAVQDFIILGLSIRRGGKSLAQIAYQEAGPVAGTAATIGILFVLIIALAGLGKVVVKALGGEPVVYSPGTRFVASEYHSISVRDAYDNISIYRIPKGTTVEYPGGAKITVGHEFDLITGPKNRAAPPALLDVPGTKPGAAIEIGPDIDAHYNVSGSAWGTFTIFLTIPIALFIGVYMTKLRKGKVLEASIIGVLLTLGAVWLGGIDQADNPITVIRNYFSLSESNIALSMAIYGFIAAVLPVSVLLCPRDYLSAFLKIGTVAMLVLGVILAHPVLHAPAINEVFIKGGPTVPGNIFPFLFITIMCGAVSGFHALVASGTTPKMINNEKDARTIGYGAMLIEGLVGIVALIAAASLPAAQYYHMNTATAELPKYQQQIVALEAASPGPPLSTVETSVKENLTGRTGGAVTLAVGMAKIFDDAAKGLTSNKNLIQKFEDFVPYWYHFAIMFEALFILTTIDAGTRVGRFLLQETMGKWIHPQLGKTAWWPSTLLSTALVVGGWYYFINSESFNAIWPMFGVSNQMLAVIALCVATVALVRGGKGKYAWVTLLPMIAVTITTMSAAVMLEIGFYNRFTNATKPHEWVNPLVAGILILGIVACTAIIMISSLIHARRPITPDAASPDNPLTSEAPTLG